MHSRRIGTALPSWPSDPDGCPRPARVVRLQLFAIVLLTLVGATSQALTPKDPIAMQETKEGTCANDSHRHSAEAPLEILVIGIPFSPLHGLISIGQELCLRGHNVTVASFGIQGRDKVEKYSPACPLRYVELGPLPIPEAELVRFTEEVSRAGITWTQMFGTVRKFFGAFAQAHAEPLEQLLASGTLKPQYVLTTLFSGDALQVLDRHGIPYGFTFCSVLINPVLHHIAYYVPPFFYPVSLHNTTFIDRLIIFTTSWTWSLLRRGAAILRVRLPVPELNYDTFVGRLVMVNSIPGLDYPQPLPPLVQYTGPLVDVQKHQAFPPEVEEWLAAVPDGVPVVYVSFGTIFVLSPAHVASLIRTLNTTDFHVLWALPEAQQSGLPVNLPKNMFVHKWIPTVRALSHPKVRAFVSHCGGNSAAESMALGVPIVGYPQFGDQPAVCQRIADAGAGVTAPRGSRVQLPHVRAVLRDPAYAARAAAVARLGTLFGGVARAADLVELAAEGHVGLLTLPQDRSPWDWFTLGGYDVALALLGVACVAWRGVARMRAASRLIWFFVVTVAVAMALQVLPWAALQNTVEEELVVA